MDWKELIFMATNWQIGDKIQRRWEIHRILGGAGKSGMGIVYVVYDHEWKQFLAAKTFQKEALARNPQAAERFQQEALTWVNLDAHQNVVRANFMQIVEGRPLLFLEFVNGGDLGRWIGTRQLTANLNRVLRFGAQFCDGINHILAKGIVAHRDIKPSNCLITDDRVFPILKLTDFGLSKVYGNVDLNGRQGDVSGHDFSSRLSVTGIGEGTPPYMAPEQFLDAKHVDVRADIYSFGIMLFQMVTGYLPFVARNWQDWQRQHEKQAPAGLRPSHGIREAARLELQELIQACLAKRPEERPRSFAIVRERLQSISWQQDTMLLPSFEQGRNLNAAQLHNKGISLDVLGRKEAALAAREAALTTGEAALADCEATLATYEAALRTDRCSLAAWYSKGDVLFKMGRNEEALAAYEAALRIDSDSIYVWSCKGLALKALGRKEEALAAFQVVLRINPDDKYAWYSKGEVLFDSGEFREALACFTQAARWDHRDAGQMVALCRQRLSQQAGAATPDPTGLLRQGLDATKAERWEEALAAFDAALRLNPRLEQAWYNKGIVLYALGQKEEALAAFEAALRINPRNEAVWDRKGRVLFSLDRNEEALAAYEEALRINPRFDKAWSNKGKLMLSGFGRTADAVACYEQAQKLGNTEAGKAAAWWRLHGRSGGG